MPSQLTNFFCPKSVAILGASRSPEKVGAIILKNIQLSGFKGKIYPINPNTTVINELPCFKSVAELPDIPDLIISALPAEQTVGFLEEISNKRIKNIVILASGFKEIGSTGQDLENKLLEIAKKNSLNILGPNCLGFVNNEFNINATFGQPVTYTGNIKFISQSGAVAASVFDWFQSLEFGFSEFITLGNKSVLNECDILEYFLEQSNTDNTLNWPIGMYLESISNGPEFMRLCMELSKKHPMFIIKPGKTKAAANAMKSHTGSMAGQDDILDAALSQAGVIRCDTMEDFFDLSRGFSWGVIPEGPNVAVISNAGGPAVLTADSVVLNGLNLVEFDDATKDKLSQVLPRSASIHDPVDLLGDAMADRYKMAADILLNNPQVHSLLFILTPQLMTQIEQTAVNISELSKKYKKPIYCSFIGGTKVFEGEIVLNKNHIPVFRFPERAIYVISKMWKYKTNKDFLYEIPPHEEPLMLPQGDNQIRGIIQEAVNEKYASLDNVAADTIVKAIDINTPPTSNITTYEEGLDFAEKYGWPVVLKISSHGTLHKKKLGGVITEIYDENSLKNSLNNMQLKIEELVKTGITDPKIQIQKQITGGIEVIVGLKKDPTFGYVLMFGAGGSFVELINDRNIHLLPMTFYQARRLVESSKVYKVLQSSSFDLNKLYDLIVRVSMLSLVLQEASEIEINPVIVTADNVWAVDTKIVMNDNNLPSQPQVKSTGPKYKIARTLENKNLASKFNSYKFETEEPLIFSAGQYISVKVAETAIRAYSIATKTDDHHFELLVDTRPGGPGSQYFEALKPGDKMEFLGPFGKFIYTEEDGADDLLFLATGSGASAVRCMIDHALLEKKSVKKLKLYFGLTYDHEVFWRDHFAELSVKYPNFTFEICLFKPSDEWVGARGFITELVKRDYPNASKCSAYLCGHRAMIADASAILLANGCPQERIYTEKFV